MACSALLVSTNGAFVSKETRRAQGLSLKIFVGAYDFQIHWFLTIFMGLFGGVVPEFLRYTIYIDLG